MGRIHPFVVIKVRRLLEERDKWNGTMLMSDRAGKRKGMEAEQMLLLLLLLAALALLDAGADD